MEYLSIETPPTEYSAHGSPGVREGEIIFEPADQARKLMREKMNKIVYSHIGKRKSQPTIDRNRSIAKIKTEVELPDDYFDDPDILTTDCPSIKRDMNNTNVYEAMCKREKRRPCASVNKQLQGRVLQIKYGTLCPEDIRPLAIALTLNTTVTILDLPGNNIGPVGGEYIAQALSENCFLKELDLSENGLGRNGAVPLCEALHNNRWLKRLNLSGNGLAEYDAMSISQVLRTNSHIQTLGLSHNEFGAQGGVYLGKALGKNTTLKYLDISWNHIRLNGAEAMCLSLKVNRSLKLLNLRFNGLGNEGCRMLEKSLPSNRTLEALDISCNRINVVVFKSLLNGLKRNTGLKALNLGDNPLCTGCATSLLEMIRDYRSCKIAELGLEHVAVDKQFLGILNEIRHRKPFRVTHDVTFRHEIQVRDREVISDTDPMEHIIKYIRSKNLRVVDVFRNFDINNDHKLSRDELSAALKTLDIFVSKAAMRRLVERLDTDGDGEIDLGEMLAAHKSVRRKLNREKTAAPRLEDMFEIDSEASSVCDASADEEDGVSEEEEEDLSFYLEEMDGNTSSRRRTPVGAPVRSPGLLPYTATGKRVSLPGKSAGNPPKTFFSSRPGTK